jgi:hypothetical protein
MNTYSRNGFKWNINELLSLQREFELLDLSVDQIAEAHKRTPNAIMYKLDQEGLADYNVLYSNYNNLNAQMPVYRKQNSELILDSLDEEQSESESEDGDYIDDEEEQEDEEEDYEEEKDDEIVNLSERVDGLEDNINEIKNMIQKMMSSMNISKCCI